MTPTPENRFDLIDVFDYTDHDAPVPPTRYAYVIPMEQQIGEPAHQYQHRLLCHALTHGIGHLTRQQLEHADSAAQAAVAQLPGRIDQHDQAQTLARLDTTLHDLRLRMQRAIAEKRARWDAFVRELESLPDAPAMPGDAPDATQNPLEALSEDERAARLLRAALISLMQPGAHPDQDDDQGGRGARLKKPVPSLPPSGAAATRPATRLGRF